MEIKLKTKECSKCRKVKSLNGFRERKDSKDGYYGQCKSCETEYTKIWYRNNPETSRENNRKWRENNPEYNREWNKNNAEKIKLKNRKNAKKRYFIPQNKLSRNISTVIRYSLKGKKNNRHWELLIGYSLKDLMNHLKLLFKNGMSWSNYGKNGWEIDHKIPINLWEFSSYEDKEFKQCWALCNLQPLWANENRLKGIKVK